MAKYNQLLRIEETLGTEAPTVGAVSSVAKIGGDGQLSAPGRGLRWLMLGL